MTYNNKPTWIAQRYVRTDFSKRSVFYMISFLCRLCRASMLVVLLFVRLARQQSARIFQVGLQTCWMSPQRQKIASLSTFVINVRGSWSDWRKQQRSWRISNSSKQQPHNSCFNKTGAQVHCEIVVKGCTSNQSSLTSQTRTSEVTCLHQSSPTHLSACISLV